MHLKAVIYLITLHLSVKLKLECETYLLSVLALLQAICDVNTAQQTSRRVLFRKFQVWVYKSSNKNLWYVNCKKPVKFQETSIKLPSKSKAMLNASELKQTSTKWETPLSTNYDHNLVSLGHTQYSYRAASESHQWRVLDGAALLWQSRQLWAAWPSPRSTSALCGLCTTTCPRVWTHKHDMY